MIFTKEELPKLGNLLIALRKAKPELKDMDEVLALANNYSWAVTEFQRQEKELAKPKAEEVKDVNKPKSRSK